ncbi:hypothetical protein ABPG75_005580 [Micractinium tetrahymenae]
MEGHLRALGRHLPAQRLTPAAAAELEEAFAGISSRLHDLTSSLSHGGSEADTAELARLLRTLAQYSAQATAHASIRASSWLFVTGVAITAEAAHKALQKLPASCQLHQQHMAALVSWPAALLPTLAACASHASPNISPSNLARSLKFTARTALEGVRVYTTRGHEPLYATELQHAQHSMPLLLSSLAARMAELALMDTGVSNNQERQAVLQLTVGILQAASVQPHAAEAGPAACSARLVEAVAKCCRPSLDYVTRWARNQALRVGPSLGVRPVDALALPDSLMALASTSLKCITVLQAGHEAAGTRASQAGAEAALFSCFVGCSSLLSVAPLAGASPRASRLHRCLQLLFEEGVLQVQQHATPELLAWSELEEEEEEEREPRRRSVEVLSAGADC